MSGLRILGGIATSIAIAGLALQLASCSDSDEQPGSDATGPGGDARVVPDSGADADDVDSAANGTNLSVLGYGTDVFGKYASSENVLGRVVDVDALDAAQMLSVTDEESAQFVTVSGTTITEYASDLGVSIGLEGKYKFFSGSIRTNFDKSHYSSEEFSFATTRELVMKRVVKVKNEYQRPAALKDYLTSEASDALSSWLPRDIFKAFGTHVMVGIYDGARLDYNLSIRIQNQEDRTSLEAFAKAGYKSLFASASIDVSIDTETRQRMMQHEKTTASTSSAAAFSTAISATAARTISSSARTSG